LISFALGVYRAAGQATAPRIVSALIIGNAIVGLVAITFFPTRYGVRPNIGSANVILMFISVVFFVLAMVFGAVAFGGWFRVLSIMIPASYIILALMRFATASKSVAGNAGILIGAQERTMAYSFLVWVFALSIYLLMLLTNGADPAS